MSRSEPKLDGAALGRLEERLSLARATYVTSVVDAHVAAARRATGRRDLIFRHASDVEAVLIDGDGRALDALSVGLRERTIAVMLEEFAAAACEAVGAQTHVDRHGWCVARALGFWRFECGLVLGACPEHDVTEQAVPGCAGCDSRDMILHAFPLAKTLPGMVVAAASQASTWRRACRSALARSVSRARREGAKMAASAPEGVSRADVFIAMRANGAPPWLGHVAAARAFDDSYDQAAAARRTKSTDAG